MTTEPHALFTIRRILAAFGPSTASPAALEGVVEVAARLGADLDALFVEDVRLLELAELPVARQVSLHGGRSQTLVRRDLERELGALARQAERRLAEAASRRHVRCSFKVTRGQVSAEVTAAAAGTDLLILECVSRPLGREARVEVAVRQMVAEAQRSVMLVPPAGRPTGSVHVLLEDHQGGDRLLQAARELASRYGGPRPVEVRLPAGAPLAAGVDALLTAVGAGTLVLAADSPLLDSEACWQRIAKAPCSVLLVR
jgi:nucleotide-binding universal stress UspA family protein